MIALKVLFISRFRDGRTMPGTSGGGPEAYFLCVPEVGWLPGEMSVRESCGFDGGSCGVG